MKLAGRKVRMPSLRYGLFVLSVVLLIASAIVVWWSGSRRPIIGRNFTYSADVIAADDYYDQAAGRYSGVEYSSGKFYAQAIRMNDDTTTLRTTLNVRTLNGQVLANMSKQFPVSAQSGKILGNAQAYLFAPTGLRKGQDFTGSYMLYDQPAHMHYVDTDTIYGLHVYHYVAQYPTSDTLVADGVPTPGLAPGQLAVFHPDVQFWIEPVTGWLIKIEDNTTIDVADALTGKTVTTYNTFSAHYSDASVRQQAAYASSLKYQVDFARHIAPSAVFLLLLIFPIIWFAKRMHSNRAVFYGTGGVLALGIVLAAVGWTFHYWPLMTLLTGSVGLNPVAIINFGLVLFCLALLYKRASRWLSGGVSLLLTASGIVALAGVLHLVGFRLDEIIDHATVAAVSGIRPSQISMHDAGMFIILGLGMARIAFRRDSASLRFSSFMAGLVIVFNVACLLVQFLQINQQFSITFLYPLSAGMSILFLCSGYLLLVVAQRFRNANATSSLLILRQLVRPALISLPILLIAVVAQFRQNVVNEELRTAFMVQTANVQTRLTDQLNVYRATLMGTQALFAASHSVESDEWHTYIADYSSGTLTDGIETIGYAPIVPANQAAAYSRTATAADGSTLTIFPSGLDNPLTPVRYVDPETPLAQKQRGYDLSTDQTIATALTQARDTGSSSITSALRLGGLPGTPNQVGFLMAEPVYDHGLPTATAAERAQATNGYVFAIIGMKDFVQHVIGLHAAVDFQVYDGNLVDSEALLYDSKGGFTTNSYAPKLSQTTTISILNHPWTIAFEAPPTLHLDGDQAQIPNIILAAGSLTYLLAVGAVYLIVLYRRRGRAAERRLRIFVKRQHHSE